MNTLHFKVKGMHCGGCKLAVEKQLNKLVWVESAEADHHTGDCWITYSAHPETPADSASVKMAVEAAVIKAGYTIGSWDKSKSPALNPMWVWGGLLLLFGAVVFLSPLALPAIGQIPPTISYGALFGLGLMTSIHCIGMCGGINLSVTLTSKGQAWRASAAYNLGRMIGYTTIGAILGAIGGAFSLSPMAKGMIAIAASLLMFLMALKQLELLKGLRLPKLLPPAVISRLSAVSKPGRMPLLVGIANSLMPCGPLQAMQLYALSTGSWWLGATGMLIFSMGTVPMMFSFGLSAAALGHRFNKPLRQGSALLLAVLAVISLQRGLALTGPLLAAERNDRDIENPNANTNNGATVDGSDEATELPSGAVAKIVGDTQEVYVEVTPFGYQDVILQVGVPAKVIFKAGDRSLTSCNEAIIIPEYDIQAGLVPGETVVTFTPEAVGEFPYSCWMGMIGNTIYVVDKLPGN